MGSRRRDEGDVDLDGRAAAAGATGWSPVSTHQRGFPAKPPDRQDFAPDGHLQRPWSSPAQADQRAHDAEGLLGGSRPREAAAQRQTLARKMGSAA